MKIRVGKQIGSYSFDASNSQITLSGISDVETEDLYLITNISSGSIIYNFASDTKNGYVSGSIIYLNYDTSAMADSDKLQILLEYDDVGKDFTLNSDVNTQLNPISEQYTDVDNLVTSSDIGATNDTWVDQGSEIDCRTYKTIGVYINFTLNNSTGSLLQVLSKHTFGGSNEYELESTSDYQKSLGEADRKVAYFFDVQSIPYIQIQTKATTVGATEATVDIDITKEW